MKELPPFIIPRKCNNPKNIGFNCCTSNNPCDILQPCQNGGTCNNTDAGYHCSCPSGFNGDRCEFDHRPCKPHTCLNGDIHYFFFLSLANNKLCVFFLGVCNKTPETTFNCICNNGWQGKNCESMIHGCDDKPCLNGGVCQPIPHGYECKCLGDSYSGRHCEIIGKKIFILKIVSKSFAYIAIIVMSSAAMFVVIMDILKYCFGIDPVQEERERIRRKKQAKRRKNPADQQLIIVNTALNPFEKPLSTIEVTTI
jgi:hypothetical protein